MERRLVIMSKTQKRSAVTLIREECANCFQGQCLPLDTACPQINSDSLLCRWFRDAVLPLDGQLHAQVMGAGGLKTCEVCGGVFRALSNRAKYCAGCAAKERKKATARRVRECKARKRAAR